MNFFFSVRLNVITHSFQLMLNVITQLSKHSDGSLYLGNWYDVLDLYY